MSDCTLLKKEEKNSYFPRMQIKIYKLSLKIFACEYF